MATNFKCSGVDVCGFSPSGKYLSICAGELVSIYMSSDLSAEWTSIRCRHPVQFIQWSPDGEFLACAQYNHGIVQIWCLSELKWNCCIDEGNLGLIKATWAPDSRHVFTTAEFHLRLTVWSLVDKRVSYIKKPKNVEMNLVCKRDSSVFAVLERKKDKDFVSVFNCNSCSLINQLECDLKDASGMCLSPNEDDVVCVWDSPLYMAVILLTLGGELIGKFEDDSFSSRLGLKTISWSPTGQLLALTTFDRRVLLLNNLTAGLVTEFIHKNGAGDSETTVFVESASKFVLKKSFAVQASVANGKEVENRGFITLEFDGTGRNVFAVHGSCRNVVWVWNVMEQSLKFQIVFKENITVVSCDPNSSAVLMCCAGGNVFHWSIDGHAIVEGPKKINQTMKGIKDVERVEWNSERVLMKSKTQCQVLDHL